MSNKKEEGRQGKGKAKGVGHSPSDQNQRARTAANKARHIAQAAKQAALHK